MKQLVFILFFLPSFVFPQSLNLVANPSFEETTGCVIGYNFPYLTDWYNPTPCSPDAYLECMDIAIPSTVDAVKRHSGTNRAGIFVYDSNNANISVREYLANKLVVSLKASKQYCFSVYLIARKNFRFGSDKFGVYFSNGQQFYNVGCDFVANSPQLSLAPGVFINDTANWYNFQEIYTATGGESDMVLGSFVNDGMTNLQVINTSLNSQDGSYFVVDDVSLYEMSIDAGMDALTCPQNLITTIGEINSDTLFKNYYWYDASGVLIDSINSQITVQPTSNTFYIEEKRMCGQSLWDTVYVNIDTVCPPDPPTPEIELIVPNVFSPNDDGINDVWQLQIDEQKTKEYSCIIYNRYGIKMFESNSQKEAWSGRTTSGTKCSEGVYYYIIEFTNSKEEKETHRGYISLFR